MLKKWLSDASLSTVVAGFVAVLVGFTSSAAIVFSAAQALGANEAQTASWMWALGLGMGGTSLVLSLWYLSIKKKDLSLIHQIFNFLS